MATFHPLSSADAGLALDLAAGHIRDLRFTDAGRAVAPFHTAAWVDDSAITGDLSLDANLRHLSGDFFCAPFCGSDVEAAPPHGWPANSPWRPVEETRLGDGVTALFRLERTVLGATVEKRLTLRDGHPFLYETHTFRGGHGAVPVANHAMVTLPDGGRLAFSPKRRFETPATAPEPDPARGRSLLAYPASVSDPTRMPLAAGGTADLTRYPIGERHEEFVMAVEAPGRRLGWLAVSRPAQGDAMLTLKSPGQFPVTFLWLSNGGRDYSPWNGRHVGVLGIEEGRSFLNHGHRASVGPNPLADAGVPTALTLDPDGTVEVRNVIGAVALPHGGAAVRDIDLGEGELQVTFEDGASRRVPFDTAFLSA